MPRHITHPRKDHLMDVYDRSLMRAQRQDDPQIRRDPVTIALASMGCRESLRSGRGG